MDTIAALADQLLARQMAEEDKQAPFRQPLVDGGKAPQTPMTMSPGVAQMVGALADAGSTYSFLKRGTGVEGNAAWKGTANDPLKTAAGVAGSGLMNLVGRALLHRTGNMTLQKLADLMVANEGANQIGLAAQNVSHDYGDGFRSGADSQREVNAKVFNARNRR